MSRTLALLLLLCSPAVSGEGPSEQLVLEETALKRSFLEAQPPAAPRAPEGGWPAALAPRAQALQDNFKTLSDLLGRLAGAQPQQLAAEVRLTGSRLSCSLPEVEAALPRYFELQSVVRENGLIWNGTAFAKPDGKAVDAAQLAALTPKLDEKTRAELEANNAELFEIGKLAEKGQHQEAAQRLAKVLDGLGQRGDLLEAGFGSLPMQTTLSLVQRANELLPENMRPKQNVSTIDSQLQALAARRISVPLPTKDAMAEPPTLKDQAQLAFFSALSAMPLVSGWAKEKHYVVSTERLLRQNTDVESYERRGPSGFFIKFKDGGTRAENAAGEVDVTTLEGRMTSHHDPKTGRTMGRFDDTFFVAEPGETISLSPDKQVLLVAKDGKVTRWYGKGSKGVVVPGVGMTNQSWNKQGARLELAFDKTMAKRLSAGEDVDMTGVPVHIASQESLAAYSRFLRELPQFGALYENSLDNKTSEYKAGGKDVKQDNWVEKLSVVDGRLEILFGEKFDGGEARTGHRMVVSRETDGSLKVFEFINGSTFMWTMDKDFKVCERFRENADAKVKEGRVAFDLGERLENKGGTWTTVTHVPITLSEMPSKARIFGGAVLSGVGDTVGVVFSPFQTALYTVEAGIWTGGGAVGSLIDSEHTASAFSKVQGIYTLKQAKFNDWLGMGTGANETDPKKRDEKMMQAFEEARLVINDKTSKDLDSFLDGEIDAMRRKTYGELYRFHSSDSITRKDRAYMAAQVFGLGNMPSQYFKSGREAYERGDTVGVIGNYAAGGFVIAGEAFVQGAGFGMAANSVKLGAAAGAAGLTAEEVALSMRLAKTGAQLTDKQNKAVALYRGLTRIELGAVFTPVVGQMAVDTAGIITAKNPDERWRHIDGLYSGFAGFGGMAFGMGRSLIESGVEYYSLRKSELAKLAPKLAEGPDSYRQRVVASEPPKAQPDGVVSQGENSAVLTATVEGQPVQVKVVVKPGEAGWNAAVEGMDADIARARQVQGALPAGMAPKVIGEVNIGDKGNPAWAAEPVNGKPLDALSAAEAGKINNTAMVEAAEALRALRAAGITGDPKFVVLTADQVINGVPRKAGSVVIVDVGTTPGTMTPEALTTGLARAKLKGMGVPDTALDQAAQAMGQKMAGAGEVFTYDKNARTFTPGANAGPDAVVVRVKPDGTPVIESGDPAGLTADGLKKDFNSRRRGNRPAPAGGSAPPPPISATDPLNRMANDPEYAKGVLQARKDAVPYSEGKKFDPRFNDVAELQAAAKLRLDTPVQGMEGANCKVPGAKWHYVFGRVLALLKPRGNDVDTIRDQTHNETRSRGNLENLKKLGIEENAEGLKKLVDYFDQAAVDPGATKTSKRGGTSINARVKIPGGTLDVTLFRGPGETKPSLETVIVEIDAP